MLIVVLVAVVVIVILYRRMRRTEAEMRAMSDRRTAELSQRASRAVAASRGSYDGHVAEQMFAAGQQTYNPKDIFHFGGVVDYIVFDGLHDVRHAGRDPRTVSVVLVDVKWGTARTSEPQKAVMEAIAGGRVRAEVWRARTGDQGELTYRNG